MLPEKRLSGVMMGILFGLVAASAADAETQPSPGFDRAGREALFQEIRALESESHRERIRILQEAETCIQRARVFREYRECEWAEQQAREQLRGSVRPKREALRDRIRAVRY